MLWVSLVHGLHWLATLIYLGLIIYGWRFRTRPAARALLLFFLLAGTWTLFAALIYLAPDLQSKILLNRIKLVAVSWLPLSIFALAVFFQGTWKPSRVTWFTMSFLPLLCSAVLLSPYHELLKTGYQYFLSQPHSPLFFKDGPLFHYFNIYTRVIILWALGVIFLGALSIHANFRRPSYLLGLSILIPFIADSIAVFYIQEMRYVQVTPTVLAFTSLMLAYIVFQHKGLEVVPLSRNWVFEKHRDIYLLFDPQGRLVDYNKAAEKLFPRLGQCYAKNYEDIFSNQTSLIQSLKEAQARGNSLWSYSNRDYAIESQGLNNPQGQLVGFLGIIQDITKNKQLEKDLRELSFMKSQVLGIMAHDLVGHSRNLSMTSQVLKESGAQMPEVERVEVAEIIYQSAEAMNKLIQEVLAWSKSHIHNTQPRKDLIDLEKLVSQVFEFLNPLALVKSLKLEMKVEKTGAFFSDTNMLKTVLRNLLENALKNSPDHAEVVVVVKSLDCGHIQLQVSDQGPEADLVKINHIFFPELESQENAPSERSSSLGLALCRDLVRRLGGQIWFETFADSGETGVNRVSVSLPSLVTTSAEELEFPEETSPV